MARYFGRHGRSKRGSDALAVDIFSMPYIEDRDFATRVVDGTHPDVPDTGRHAQRAFRFAYETFHSGLTVSLSGRQPQFDKRREHILINCARGTRSLAHHGRSKRG